MDMDHTVGEIDVDPREVECFIEPQAGADEDGDEGGARSGPSLTRHASAAAG